MRSKNGQEIVFKSIGTIHSPFTGNAPHQTTGEMEGDFTISLLPEYTEALQSLETFRYIYVIYYLNRQPQSVPLRLSPPWASGKTIGLFASRSPNRPNPVGLSVVRLKKVVKNTLFISGIDAFDGTPVLDIKPYIDRLDAKTDANFGWIDLKDGYAHFEKHLKGIPHNDH